VKSIKTSLLLASVLLTAGVAFAAQGPNKSDTVQLDENKYDISTKQQIEAEDKMVVLAKNGNAWLRTIFEVQARALPTPPSLLIVQEQGEVVSQPPVRGTRWDVVEKQNSFQYKYKARKAAAAE
jgi:hypothetical protein